MKVDIVCDCISVDEDEFVRHIDRMETVHVDVDRVVMMWPSTRRVVVDCGGRTEDLHLGDESFCKLLDAFETRR